MAPLAELEVEDVGTTVVAHLRGEVDLSNVDDLRARLVESVSHTADRLVLDLTSTSYLDSTGVRLLFELARRLQARRQELRLVVTDAALVRRVLVLTQLDEAVPILATVDEALASPPDPAIDGSGASD